MCVIQQGSTLTLNSAFFEGCTAVQRSTIGTCSRGEGKAHQPEPPQRKAADAGGGGGGRERECERERESERSRRLMEEHQSQRAGDVMTEAARTSNLQTATRGLLPSLRYVAVMVIWLPEGIIPSPRVTVTGTICGVLLPPETLLTTLWATVAWRGAGAEACEAKGGSG